MALAWLHHAWRHLTKIMETIETRTEITCPICGHREVEQMPTDHCLVRYECRRCRTLLRPLEGDCCVFCSYATRPCPPVQASGKSCC